MRVNNVYDEVYFIGSWFSSIKARCIFKTLFGYGYGACDTAYWGNILSDKQFMC